MGFRPALSSICRVHQNCSHHNTAQEAAITGNVVRINHRVPEAEHCEQPDQAQDLLQQHNNRQVEPQLCSHNGLKQCHPCIVFACDTSFTGIQGLQGPPLEAPAISFASTFHTHLMSFLHSPSRHSCNVLFTTVTRTWHNVCLFIQW